MAAIQIMLSLIAYAKICAKLCKKLSIGSISKIKFIELKWVKHFPDTLKILIIYTVIA